MAADFVERGNAASQAKTTTEKLHAFRIASEKFRYTLELFAPLYGPTLNSWLESIKGIQTLLGDINDCVTVTEMLADYKGAGEVAGWLKKRQRRKVEQFSRHWLRIWRPGKRTSSDRCPEPSGPGGEETDGTQPDWGLGAGD